MAAKAERGAKNLQSLNNSYPSLPSMDPQIMPPMNMYMDPKLNPSANYNSDPQLHIPNIPKVKVNKKSKNMKKTRTKQVPTEKDETKAPVKRRGKGAGRKKNIFVEKSYQLDTQY